jgi:nicotinamide-nucleotide adenylyltransferase
MTTKSQRALFVGRFQPFHLGHQEAILQILRENEEVIIVIGSAQKSHDVDNPFTAGERIMMIRDTLNALEVEATRYYLIPIPDASMHVLWTSQVIAYCPNFSVVYSNEPLTRCLFKEVGREVKPIPMLQRKIYCATEIRKRMLHDGNWQQLVPSSVVKVIDKIHGVERLKDLIKFDSPFPTKR